MNIRPWVFSIVLGAGCTALRAAPQNNFLDCFHGFADCDKKQLTAEQRQEVARARRIQNLESCVDGIGGCDTTLLTEKQKKPITTTTSRSAWKVWATATALCSAAKDSKRLPRKRTTGSFASASMVPMPAIPLSLAAPNSATSP